MDQPTAVGDVRTGSIQDGHRIRLQDVNDKREENRRTCISSTYEAQKLRTYSHWEHQYGCNDDKPETYIGAYGESQPLADVICNAILPLGWIG